MKVLIITDHDRSGSYITDVLLIDAKTNPYDVDPILEKWIQQTGSEGCFTAFLSDVNEEYNVNKEYI